MGRLPKRANVALSEDKSFIQGNGDPMLDILKYKYDLWKLQQEKDKTRRIFGKEMAEAEKKKASHDDMAHIVGEEMYFIDTIDEQIAQLQGQLLRRQAERYLIPFPKRITKNGDWEQSKITGRWLLGQKTVSELRNAIRREQKDRREKWQGWLALLIGLIGALIGLLSVL